MAVDLRKLEEIFHVAVSVEPDSRAHYLDSACDKNEELRHEVESLVSAYESSGDLLEENAVTMAMKLIGSKSTDSMIGQEIGPYKILSALGQGGMGSVYLAQDSRLDRKVALKFLSGEFVADNWAKRQLIKEAQAVARLDHSNICAVYGFDEIGDHSFIVMQYIEGQTLADLIRTRSLKPEQIGPLAQQIVSALAEAHAHGIIHRDIKPKNIMVTRHEQVKVLDFGLAKTVPKTFDDATESISQLSRDGLLVGTIAYMSPEQLRGEKLDYRSDIFSMGTVLYEMACGKNPYAHKTNAEVISAIMSREPESLRQVSINCPRALEQIVRKCLRKERAERYQSAVELLIDLENVQKGIALPTKVHKYLNLRSAALAAVVLLTFVLGTFIYSSWSVAGHTLAVMPISCDEGEDAKQCQKVTDDLVKTLSRRTGLRVTSSRVAPSLFGPNAASPQKLGKELEADIVMFGKVGRGEKGHILTIRVERVGDGFRMWEKSYPFELEDGAMLQRRISLETAVELQLPPNEDDKELFELIAAKDNRSADAYRLYLQGRTNWSLRDGENIKKAIDNFRRAIELDPTYAEAYAGLADCYVLLPTVAYGSLAGPDAMVRAKWAARQALAFGPNLAESHNAFGSVLLKGDWDWENAEKEFQKAIALNPDYQPAHFNYSSLLQVTGRFDEALRESQFALNQDPFSGAAIMNNCRSQYVARQFDEADACLNRLAADRPDYAGGKYMHGIVYNAMGRTQESTKIFEEIYAKDRAYGGAVLGYTYGISGRRADAERVLNEMLDYQKGHYLPDQEIGIIYLGMGDLEHAFPLLSKSVEAKFPPAQSFFYSPSFERLRVDPRFSNLMKQARLPMHAAGASSSVSTSAK
jgi:serine/threonine protein kinase/Tfp pilus assembly protein PilF